MFKVKSQILKPVRVKSNDFVPSQREIERVIYEEIYRPLIESFSDDMRLNSTGDALIDAIRSGRVSFSRGKFSGKFSSKITKELQKMGAKFNRSKKTYDIYMANIPYEYRAELAASNFRLQMIVEKMDKHLRKVVPRVMAEKINVFNSMDTTLFRVDGELNSTLKAITVKEEMPEHKRKAVAQDYQESVRRHISGWTEEKVQELRLQLSDKLINGGRAKDLIGIVKNFGVSYQARAAFIARQETSLYISSLKKARYADAGIDEYEWRCSHDGHEIRKDHLKLDRTRQKFSQPPVTDSRTGARNNPGEDFNCYCEAWPIVNFG